MKTSLKSKAKLLSLQRKCNYKNMERKKIASFLTLFFISISIYAQSFVKNDTVRVEFHDGIEWAYAVKNGIAVAVSNVPIKTDYGNFYQLRMEIKNLRDSCVLYVPDSTSACIYNRGRQKPLKIYSSEQFQRKIEVNQAWESALCELAMGFDRNYNVANSITSSILLSESQSNAYNVLNCGYMKKNTIRPQSIITGFLNMKKKEFNTMVISMPVDDTVFSFEWTSENIRRSTDDGVYY